MDNVNLDDILTRVGEVIGSDKDTDIAKALNSGRSTLSTWRKREHIPYKNIISFCLAKGVAIEWVLMGGVRKCNNLYDSPHEALSVVLDVQSELNLTFTADQIKSLLAYAYSSQLDKEGLISFVQHSFEIANKPLPIATSS